MQWLPDSSLGCSRASDGGVEGGSEKLSRQLCFCRDESRRGRTVVGCRRRPKFEILPLPKPRNCSGKFLQEGCCCPSSIVVVILCQLLLLLLLVSCYSVVLLYFWLLYLVVVAVLYNTSLLLSSSCCSCSSPHLSFVFKRGKSGRKSSLANTVG